MFSYRIVSYYCFDGMVIEGRGVTFKPSKIFREEVLDGDNNQIEGNRV
ncbi:MAG: hypothetical protein QG588_1270 [Candidatus Poribacteria bacterium]|nr:hypothetical protein [Candidatus Poribacteria bacterium]